MKKMSTFRFIAEKVVLGAVGIACVVTFVPFFLAILESLIFAPTVSEKSLIKEYIKRLFSKNEV